ncbi:TGF-beta-activated kinase 1 and MAP3K7-binding protein 3 isoform X2 [Callorhinchus milii]|uniref:Mitogen-activated protein kinase kinase kinase 7-interacting protein 3 n=1 Tax=Callorhinchus milii TaxID=7868 RepID=V9KAC4_CALMI|nr:TGF-beta-activated kinase 1 and MAP3K7-binding protein 3 isoform X2 [Callorhinchus milii]|eukprot:gi/632974301/ref/XP_007903600.1/ PREDICTED: TGF-beta-activated kinase 1 and MAP3K7-binding protein 3 isoform X2 [Callorhinchus milii]
MAQGSQQIDIQVLHDLRQRFPEIPEGVVSQCMLQNNNNLEVCCLALAQESNKYLYGEFHSPDDTRMSRNHMLQINLGIQPPTTYQTGDGGQINGGRTLVHSTSDSHIEPQRGGGKQLVRLIQEPHSAPAVVATPSGYNPFFLSDQGRNTGTPPPQSQQPTSLQPSMNTSPMQGLSPPYQPIPRYTMNPITVTLSQNLPSGQTAPTALHIHGGPSQMQNTPYGMGNSIYIRPASQGTSGRQTPQNTAWSSGQCSLPQYNHHPPPVYQPPQSYQSSQYSPKQPQLPQQAYRSPPPSQFSSPYSSPQHQVQTNQQSHQTSHVFMPISSPTMSHLPYQPPQNYPQQGSQPMSYIPYSVSGMSKGPMKNQIEIKLETPQRSGASSTRSSSPVSSQPALRSQPTLYIATNPSGSPSRGMSGQMNIVQPQPVYSVQPTYIHHQPSRPRSSTAGSNQVNSPRVVVTQPNTKYTFKITVSPNRPPSISRGVASPTFDPGSILNLVDYQGEHPGAPEPIQPISAITGSGVDKRTEEQRRKSSSGSDDYAYTQALLLHQRARMERLLKELNLEKQKLEKLKAEVNEMEYDLMQRRLRRVNSNASIPTPEEMTKLRSLNRQLQIDIDCTLKEIDLLQSGGNFDPKAINNFYDNMGLTGPVGAVPPKSSKKEHGHAMKYSPRPHQRDEDFEGAPWNCNSCTFLNHPALNRCEQCEMPRYT